jgi:bifunctional lysine-specific demethylase and histidyl-hydroxylase NO66
VLDRQATGFWSSRTPDLSGGLRDLLELDQLEDRTALRRRRSVTAHVVEAGGRAEVVLRDRVLRMPAALIPVLRHIVDGHTLRPADLEGFLDAPSRLVLCRRLVREGVLTVDRATGGSNESAVGATGG